MLVNPRLEDDGINGFVHLQNQVELRHRYELFDNFLTRPDVLPLPDDTTITRLRTLREPSAGFNS